MHSRRRSSTARASLREAADSDDFEEEEEEEEEMTVEVEGGIRVGDSEEDIETPQLRSREKLGLDFETKMRICIEQAPLSDYVTSEKPKTAADASASAPPIDSPDARQGDTAPCEVATPGVRVLTQAAPAAGGADSEIFTLPRGTYITGGPRTSYGRRGAGLHSKRVVEYDLESDDEEVLQGMTGVDEDAFEAAIEALEDKSWSKMWKSVRVPAPPVVPESFHSNSKSDNASDFQTPKCNSRAFSVDVEDAVCSVCLETKVDCGNAILLCDGCGVGVHQQCYGILELPEESEWLCDFCSALRVDTILAKMPRAAGAPPRKRRTGNGVVACKLCPTLGGAVKETVQMNGWIHVSCAIWMPETSFRDPVRLRGIEGTDTIVRARKNLVCKVCNTKNGACIQCSHKSCVAAFHITCAQKQQCYFHWDEINEDDPDGPLVQKFFCERHEPANPPPNYYRADDMSPAAISRAITGPCGGHPSPVSVSSSNLPTVDHSPVSGPSSTPGASPPQAETESVDAAPDDSRQGGEGGGEEDTCMVCWAKSTDTEAGDGNPMYKCTSCDIIVHSLCYGAEGSRKGWTCKACKEGVVGAKCRLCPNKGGVVKRAKDGSWVHLECALWIPEITFEDPDMLEGITGFGHKTLKERNKLVCSVCDQTGASSGACIQCAKGACAAAFHVSCARKSGLHMAWVQKLPEGGKEGDEVLSMESFCSRHRPTWVFEGSHLDTLRNVARSDVAALSLLTPEEAEESLAGILPGPAERKAMFNHWERKREVKDRFLIPKYEVGIRELTGLDEGDEMAAFQCGVRRQEREEEVKNPQTPAPPKSSDRKKGRMGEGRGGGSSSSSSRKDTNKKDGNKKRKGSTPCREVDDVVGEPNWPLHKPTRYVKFTFLCSAPGSSGKQAADSLLMTPSTKKTRTCIDEEGTSATRTAPRRAAAAAVAPGAYASIAMISEDEPCASATRSAPRRAAASVAPGTYSSIAILS